MGGDSDARFLVLQVHYVHVADFADGSTDESGIASTMLPESLGLVSKSAAILLVKTDGRIPANTSQTMDGACPLTEDLIIHPFAFRTHTHSLGHVVSGWKVSGEEKEWSLIGKRDPQEPQGFYPVVDDSMSLVAGDVVASRCLMVNNRTHEVVIG